jgi:hypothetical protein
LGLLVFQTGFWLSSRHRTFIPWQVLLRVSLKRPGS